jgi:adenylate cyclase class IV
MTEETFEVEISELELKYSANDIKMSDFVTFAKSLNPIKELEVASWDYYYSGEGLPFEFIRFRNGTDPEITIKIKTTDKNNNNRIEIELPLNSKVSEWRVAKFVGLFGFKENFRIYKHCMIFWYDKLDIVYYTVFNQNMEEIGRYCEVERDKSVKGGTREEAWTLIKEMEQKMSVLGIVPQNRMRRSLWELFRKDIKKGVASDGV